VEFRTGIGYSIYFNYDHLCTVDFERRNMDISKALKESKSQKEEIILCLTAIRKGLNKSDIVAAFCALGWLFVMFDLTEEEVAKIRENSCLTKTSES